MQRRLRLPSGRRSAARARILCNGLLQDFVGFEVGIVWQPTRKVLGDVEAVTALHDPNSDGIVFGADYVGAMRRRVHQDRMDAGHVHL
jgi:hypothetical protein